MVHCSTSEPKDIANSLTYSYIYDISGNGTHIHLEVTKVGADTADAVTSVTSGMIS